MNTLYVLEKNIIKYPKKAIFIITKWTTELLMLTSAYTFTSKQTQNKANVNYINYQETEENRQAGFS